MLASSKLWRRLLVAMLGMSSTFWLVNLSISRMYAQDAVTKENADFSVDVASLSPEEVLRLMRANDAQFDNVKFRYRTTDRNEHSPISRPLGQTGSLLDKVKIRNEFGLSALDLPNSLSDGEFVTRLQRLLTTEQLARLQEMDKRGELFEQVTIHRSIKDFDQTTILRFPDLATSRDLLPGMKPVLAQQQHHRWRVTGTERKHLYAQQLSEGSPLRWVIEISSARGQMVAELADIVRCQFALGIGFGPRIRSITSNRRQNDGMYELMGEFQMWDDDTSTYRLLADDKLIVREATINIKAGDGGWAKIQTSANGFREWGDQRLRTAEKGTIQYVIRDENIEDYFDVELQDVQFDVSDEEFAEFARLEPPDGVQPVVHDYDQMGARDRPPGEVKRVTLASRGHGRAWLIWFNIVFIVVLLFLVFRSRSANYRE